MPPKKKKEKKRKTGPTKQAPFKDYVLLTFEQMNAREQQYHTMLEHLRACLLFIDDAINEVERLKASREKDREWSKFLRCTGLPAPNKPPEIRLFFTKLRTFEISYREENIDWQLRVDEKSILNQNIFREDRTRNVMREKHCPNYGKFYDFSIVRVLKVVDSIENFLEDDNMTDNLEFEVIADIKEERTVAQQEVKFFLDRLTYRVICSEGAFMNSVDAIVTEFNFTGSFFKIHIWALKNVPILFKLRERYIMHADLYEIKVTVQIPFSILEENLTLRGIHMDFDHFSEHAKSYNQIITIPTANLNAGIQDLHDCLINEWIMQLELMNEVRAKMIQRRAEYEERMRKTEEQNKDAGKKRRMSAKPEKVKKGGKGGKGEKGGKRGKPPKEVPIITDNTFPDIWTDFLQKEQMEFESFINNVYHPSVLNLSEDEINMKKYLILGGVYQLYFVSKPRHFDFDSDKFNMTWHPTEDELNIREKVFAREHTPLSAISPPRASAYGMPRPSKGRKSSVFLPTVSSAAFVTETYDEDSPHFIVTFELPRHLCLWGEPIVCHYEADVIGLIADLPDGIVPGATPQHAAKKPPPMSEGIPELDFTGGNATIIGDFNSDKPEEAVDVIGFGTNFRLSTRTSTANVFRPSMSSLNLVSRPAHFIEADPIELEDFELDLQLTKNQIRNLQRHCLTRIVSSYRFPQEILEEKTVMEKNKDMGPGGTLVRKYVAKIDESDTKNEEHVFEFQGQTNSERMFPFFPKAEELNTNDPLRGPRMVQKKQPETFFELIDMLDSIKHEFKTTYNKTKRLLPFRPKKNLHEVITNMLLPVLMSEAMSSSFHHMRRGTLKGKGKDNRLSIISARRRNTRGQSKIALNDGKADTVSNDLDMTEEGEEGEDTGEDEKEEEIEDKGPTYTYAHWTTKHIIESEFDKNTFKMTITTDRLGTMGFAFKRYEHFPFRNWSLQPSKDNPTKEVVFTLDTQYVRCVLYVTAAGTRGTVTELTTTYVSNPEKFLVIEEPLDDFKELKKLFRERNINIFTDHDAQFYIENGYFSEKHLAAELHTYCCMAIHSLGMRYERSDWNRLAMRRDIILRFGMAKDLTENLCIAHITPEESTFVQVKELCSDDPNKIKLDYTLTWRNIKYYADLHQMILSINPSALETRTKDSFLIYALRNLLQEIRPLSYS